MRTVTLGTEFPQRDELRSEVETEIERLSSHLERRLEEYINTRLTPPEPPVVNVTAPAVTVEPYNDVHVEAPDLAGLGDRIDRLIKTLNTPVVRRVVRDEQGLIVRVEETRG